MLSAAAHMNALGRLKGTNGGNDVWNSAAHIVARYTEASHSALLWWNVRARFKFYGHVTAMPSQLLSGKAPHFLNVCTFIARRTLFHVLFQQSGVQGILIGILRFNSCFWQHLATDGLYANAVAADVQCRNDTLPSIKRMLSNIWMPLVYEPSQCTIIYLVGGTSTIVQFSDFRSQPLCQWTEQPVLISHTRLKSSFSWENSFTDVWSRWQYALSLNIIC